jgi:glycosyltransferase involved in cell wall biosynthesis
MPKLVSIIYPTDGKRKELIRDSFSTLIYQTYQSWEVIIVKDEHYNFEQEFNFFYDHFKDKVRIIDVPQNCGSGYARHVGVKNSRGSYIAYLDDDDLWSETYLEEQINELENIGCDLVYCNYHLREQIFHDIDKKYVQHFISIPYSVSPFNREVLLTEPFLHLSSVVHTKDVNEIVQFSSLQSLNDWKFFLNASKFFKFHNNSKTLVTIQRRLDGTNSLTKNGNETLRNWKVILSETEHEISDEITKKIRKVIFDNYLEKYNLDCEKESEKLHTLLITRGFELAYGYLLYLILLNKLDYHICKVAHDICLLKKEEELAKDMLYLSSWFINEEKEEFKEYTPIYFKREYEQWNVLPSLNTLI